MGHTLYKQVLWAIVLAGLLIMVALHIADISQWIGKGLNAGMPLLIGAILAFVLDIAVVRYERIVFPRTKKPWLQRLRRPLCIGLAICTIIAIFIFIAWMAIPQMARSLSLLVTAVPSLVKSLQAWITPYIDMLPDGGVELMHTLQSESTMISLKEWGTKGGTYVVTMMGVIMEWTFNIVIGLIFAIYILWEKDTLRRQMDKLLAAYGSERWSGRIRYVCNTFGYTFSNFIIGQCLDALVLGVLVGVALWGFNISHALTLACVVGVTGLVPLLGVYVGALMGVLILLPSSPMEAFIYLAVLEVIHQIESNIIYPKIVGDSIGLPGIWVFAGVIVGGTLCGVSGMILGVPVVAAMYRLLQNDVAKRLGIKEETI